VIQALFKEAGYFLVAVQILFSVYRARWLVDW
jgi:hypothetical protein